MARPWIGFWVLAAATWASTSAAAPPPDGQPPGAGGEAVPDELYDAAAALRRVPDALLRAVVRVESRGSMGDGTPTRDGRYGLAGLREGGSLELAARLTGLGRDALMRDAAANLLGGAAVLADVAAGSAGLEETLARYVDLDVPEAARDYAARVVAALGPLDDYYAGALPFGRGFIPDGRSGPPIRANTGARPDYPGATWVGPACSYRAASRGAGDIEYVVVHTCEGGFSGCWSWLRGCHDVSAHYVVSTAGEVVQVVEDNDVAWHVGCLNSTSIGIEHEGRSAEPEIWYTDAMYCASAALTRWLCDAYGIPRDRDHIMGHNDANDRYCGGDHWDPGPGWDWGRYMAYVECGCGGCGPPPHPVFEMRAEIADIAGQDRDFCRLYSSDGKFDMNVGQATVQRFYVTDAGDAIGRNVVVGFWVEEPYLRVTRWDIYDNWPGHSCGAEWCLNDSNDHPENPARDDPGGAFLLHLYGLSPGETKMIEMTVEAGAYSIGLADHPDVRAWVKHVDDYYEKNDFWSTDYNNVGGYQTWNGGDLRIWSETDVLAPEECNGLDDDCDGETDEGCGEGLPDSGSDAGGQTDGPGDGLALDVPGYDGSRPLDGGEGAQGDGCGCRAAGARGAGPASALLLAALCVGRLLRRRPAGRPG